MAAVASFTPSKPAVVFRKPSVRQKSPNRNFCLYVAKKGKAFSRRCIELHNVVTGKELTAGFVEKTTPLSSDGNIMRVAGHKLGLLVRIVAQLCGMVEAHVPFGYEDEGGFHYGADVADWFFII